MVGDFGAESDVTASFASPCSAAGFGRDSHVGSTSQMKEGPYGDGNRGFGDARDRMYDRCPGVLLRHECQPLLSAYDTYGGCGKSGGREDSRTFGLASASVAAVGFACSVASVICQNGDLVKSQFDE